MSNTDKRLDELELHLAHQERQLEELGKTVTQQWKLIDRLTQRLGLLDDRVKEIEENAGDEKLPEPPPPHY